jgi:KUP system potassium uptake protein
LRSWRAYSARFRKLREASRLLPPIQRFVDDSRTGERRPSSHSLPLAIAALGVVFGDIGTSPLYTLKACFDFSGAKPTSAADVIGIASLLVWALIVVVCVKYIGFIMLADHDGEGGILALLALGTPRLGGARPVVCGAQLLTVVVGATMLLGDGSITPAISVVSAIEGIELISPAATPWVVPISVVILYLLFRMQKRGTGQMGVLFGPVMVAWFVTIAIAGAFGIARRPEILAAIFPQYALGFLVKHGPGGFFVLGGIVLAITGVEALYADMSHFGRGPIVWSWYGIVFPSLVLCYLGESATALADPTQLAQPFYGLTPGIWRIPAIVLATLATIIASQALISGAFTLVQQAIALGLSPRFAVHHTSAFVRGQVYLPTVNLALGTGCIVLVLAFKSSNALAAAFGLAVSCTMLATTLAWYYVATHTLHWRKRVALPALVLFALVDGSFILAGLPKFLEGGWVPFAVSLVLTIVSLTWHDGRERVIDAMGGMQAPIEEVSAQLGGPARDAPATMVILAPDPKHVPFYASHRWIADRIRDERVVLLRLVPERVPWIADDERVRVEQFCDRFYRVEASFGYMEPPRIKPILACCRKLGLELERDDVEYLSGEAMFVRSVEPGRFATWRRKLFVFLTGIARSLPDELGIKPERRIGVGITVSL